MDVYHRLYGLNAGSIMKKGGANRLGLGKIKGTRGAKQHKVTSSDDSGNIDVLIMDIIKRSMSRVGNLKKGS